MKRYHLHWTRRLHTRSKIIKALQSIIQLQKSKDVIVAYTLSKAAKYARREFRIAHPASFACSLCEDTFTTLEDMTAHKQACLADASEKDELAPELRSQLDVFYGSELGRQVQAKRLMFSTELGSFEWRVDATRLTKYRPHIAEEVHLNIKNRDVKLVVHDADPKGIYQKVRSSSTSGLENQFRTRFNTSKYFEDVLFEVAAQCGEAVDVVVSPQSSSHAEVKFVWRGFAESCIQIIGDSAICWKFSANANGCRRVQRLEG